MAGIENLKVILASLEPELQSETYIFCTLNNIGLSEVLQLNPLCVFREKESMTLILEKEVAEVNKIDFTTEYQLITLSVHSSLESVGLTAAFAQKLAVKGISANVVAAYYHDHIFVPKDKASEAMKALLELQQENKE